MHRQIAYLETSSLINDPSNARTHSAKQIAQIARSIESFGFNNPVLTDRAGKIIAGHGRVQAALKIGMERVPTIRLEDLNETQLRAYAIADNRLAELAGWDKEILAIELGELIELDLGCEITVVGFEMGEIDNLLDQASRPAEPEPEIPVASNVPRISRRGDLWQAGRHLIFCGDALDPLSYRVLLSNEKAHLVFTDPPYNLPIDGHVSGLGRVKHREFVQASGEMSDNDFHNFLRVACENMRAASVDGAINFVCMDWRHIEALISVGRSVYSELKNVCVWVKPNGGMGSLYRSQHEFVAVFKAGRAPHRNNVQLGASGRYRTNVWAYGGMNSFQAGRADKLAMHPTVKPVGMISDAIFDCSVRGDIVLDPFAGSGSTLLAAERTGRTCRAMELDPGYVDVILSRFAMATGDSPINLTTGERYDQDLSLRAYPARKYSKSNCRDPA